MSQVLILDPQTVRPFAGQPRKRFRGIAQLVKSIHLAGQVTPIVVTRLDQPVNGYQYELTDDERRLRACTEGGMKIKAILSDAGSAEKFAQSVAANFCRQTHDCIEVAEAIRVLKDEGRTDVAIADIFCKSNCWVSQHRSLLTLCAEAQEMLKPDETGVAPLTFSLALLMVPMFAALQRKALTWLKKTRRRMSEARNYLKNLCREKPDQVTAKRVRTHSPFEQFSTLWNAVLHTEQAFERWATLTHAGLEQIVQAGSEAQRAILADKLADCTATMAALTKTAKKSLDGKTR